MHVHVGRSPLQSRSAVLFPLQSRFTRGWFARQRVPLCSPALHRCRVSLCCPFLRIPFCSPAFCSYAFCSSAAALQLARLCSPALQLALQSRLQSRFASPDSQSISSCSPALQSLSLTLQSRLSAVPLHSLPLCSPALQSRYEVPLCSRITVPFLQSLCAVPLCSLSAVPLSAQSRSAVPL